MIPPELERAFAGNHKVKSASAKLTKGRQREYTDYIADTKRDNTKAKRLAKIIPLIESGAGLHNKYRR